jgi:hypothetical protein
MAGAALLGACRNSPETAAAATPGTQESAKQAAALDLSAKYAGSWRSGGNTLLVARQGPAFVIQTQGPAGPKDIATYEAGVLRVGNSTALYDPDHDRITYDGKDFHRIDPMEQTRKDLRLIAAAEAKYEQEYQGPPVNDFDFFHGLPKYEPTVGRFDGWGTEYRYLCKFQQRHWAVVSAGPDGVFDPVMTADMMAAGMIRTNGDDVVMVDGKITTDGPRTAESRENGTNTRPLAADPAKATLRYMGTFESPFSSTDIHPVAQIQLYRNGKTQLVGRMFYPPGIDAPHCRLDGTYDAATGKVVVRGTITLRDVMDSTHERPYTVTNLYTFQGTWRPDRLTGVITELPLGRPKQKPVEHAVTLNRRRNIDSSGEAVTTLAEWERQQ